MTKRDQNVDKGTEIAIGKRARRPYRTPQLAVYGKLAELTAGLGGSNADPGQTSQTKRGAG